MGKMCIRDRLYPGDERRIFGEALVPVFVALYNSLNDVGRQTPVSYTHLDVYKRQTFTRTGLRGLSSPSRRR